MTGIAISRVVLTCLTCSIQYISVDGLAPFITILGPKFFVHARMCHYVLISRASVIPRYDHFTYDNKVMIPGCEAPDCVISPVLYLFFLEFQYSSLM
jgi:hypothetical protein